MATVSLIWKSIFQDLNSLNKYSQFKRLISNFSLEYFKKYIFILVFKSIKHDRYNFLMN